MFITQLLLVTISPNTEYIYILNKLCISSTLSFSMQNWWPNTFQKMSVNIQQTDQSYFHCRHDVNMHDKHKKRFSGMRWVGAPTYCTCNPSYNARHNVMQRKHHYRPGIWTTLWHVESFSERHRTSLVNIHTWTCAYLLQVMWSLAILTSVIAHPADMLKANYIVLISVSSFHKHPDQYRCWRWVQIVYTWMKMET